MLQRLEGCGVSGQGIPSGLRIILAKKLFSIDVGINSPKDSPPLVQDLRVLLLQQIDTRPHCQGARPSELRWDVDGGVFRAGALWKADFDSFSGETSKRSKSKLMGGVSWVAFLEEQVSVTMAFPC